MSDNLIEKYTKFLEDLKSSSVDAAADMAKLLCRNILYYNTKSMSLSEVFTDSPELEFDDNDNTPQDLRSYNYIRGQLFSLLKQKELGE